MDCAVCNSTYHMYCVRPVLTRKPQRGFAWACAACSRAQERKLEARNTPTAGTDSQPEGEEEIIEEEDDAANGVAPGSSGGGEVTTAPEDIVPQPATADQTAQARMWPFRYLGIHCRVEDALDYDDRIYPRASSRLGARHQAVVPPWYGRPYEYVKPLDVKKKYLRPGNRKESKLPKEAQAAVSAAKKELAKRPKWVVDEPVGYIHRGEDEPVMVDGKPTRTSELLFKMPTPSQVPASYASTSCGGEGNDAAEEGQQRHITEEDRERFVDDYMSRAKEVASEKDVEMYSTNFLDKALQLFYSEGFDVEAALAKLKQVDKYEDLKEPHLLPDEIKMFEQGVSKYGSELRLVTNHVGTVPHYQIVRFYYMWKKTPRGRQIWGNYEGRRGKRDARRNSPTKLLDEVADDQDDSAFDNGKIEEKKCGFTCKFCSTKSSRQWRRAPGGLVNVVTSGADNSSSSSSSKKDKDKDKGPPAVVALCLRCALLWRKYGIQYENVDELAKKITQSSHKSWRRRVDEELLVQELVSTEMPFDISSATAATAASLGVTFNASSAKDSGTVASSTKKKNNNNNNNNSHNNKSADKDKESAEAAPKKKTTATTATSAPAAAAEKPPPEPVVPEPPRAKTLPCAVCNRVEPLDEQHHLSCRDCRLTVHRSCYGVKSSRSSSKWLCDMCSNDRNPVVSTRYECVLCPVTHTEQELMEPARASHKRKSEREREKERLEKEMVAEAMKLYRQRQEAEGKPVSPREPLKRTAGNNWVHVLCAIWLPEIKFGNAKELEPAEGFGLIPAERHREVCRVCKESNKGACVSCHQAGCNATFHVGCAFQAQYKFGFDVVPVKNSRRDSVTVVKLGDETGVASPVIWCPHHTVTSTVHEIGEPVGGKNNGGRTALQVYAQAYKQADLSLTGGLRKAAYVEVKVERLSGEPMEVDGEQQPAIGRKCCRCQTEFSPRWWPVKRSPGHVYGSGAYPHLLRNEEFYECHKCHVKSLAEARPPPAAAASALPTTSYPSSHQQHAVLRYGDYYQAPPPHANGTHAHPMPPVSSIFQRPVSSSSPQGNAEWYAAHDHIHHQRQPSSSYAGGGNHRVMGYQTGYAHPPVVSTASLSRQPYATHHQYTPPTRIPQQQEVAPRPSAYAASPPPPPPPPPPPSSSPSSSYPITHHLGRESYPQQQHRVLMAATPSPSMSPTLTRGEEEGKQTAAAGMNGTKSISSGGASGASASPSLKNLLS